jgi:uncharacterized protein
VHANGILGLGAVTDERTWRDMLLTPSRHTGPRLTEVPWPDIAVITATTDGRSHDAILRGADGVPRRHRLGFDRLIPHRTYTVDGAHRAGSHRERGRPSGGGGRPPAPPPPPPHAGLTRGRVRSASSGAGARMGVPRLQEVVVPEDRPPYPPFTRETALQKVQAAEDAWNTRDPQRVALAYTPDSQWRNRDVFLSGREEIVDFLTRKWERELDYALRKSLWSFGEDRIAVRFQYECHDAVGQWWRSYGNELWEFDEHGLMRRREASINDVAIDEADRRLRGPRPEAERGLDIPLR